MVESANMKRIMSSRDNPQRLYVEHDPLLTLGGGTSVKIKSDLMGDHELCIARGAEATQVVNDYKPS